MIAPGNSFSVATPRPDFRGLLKEDHRFATGQDNTSDAVNGWFDQLMLQSGIRTVPSVWLGLCLVVAIAIGGIAWVATEQVFVAGIGAIAGLLLPIVVASVMRSRRQKQVMEQLPGVAEELARGARSGRNVDGAFQLAAADTPSPLGDELRTAVRRCQMGVDLASAIRDLPQRTGVPATTMLVSAIAVHQDSGGDLVQVLDRLATAVRDRIHFMGRLRAATIASRMGAIMMIIVPIIIVTFNLVRNPQYLNELLSSNAGRISFWTAVALQIIGGFSVMRILNRSSRF